MDISSISRLTSKVRSVAIAFVAALAALALSLSSAQALGGECHAWMQHDVGTTRGVGYCRFLDDDTKARVTLDLKLAPDPHSKWFVKTNRLYRTPEWSAAYGYGWPRGARVDQARR